MGAPRLGAERKEGSAEKPNTQGDSSPAPAKRRQKLKRAWALEQWCAAVGRIAIKWI